MKGIRYNNTRLMPGSEALRLLEAREVDKLAAHLKRVNAEAEARGDCPKERPDRETMRRTIAGEETGWTYSCSVPPVYHGNWTPDNWIDFIGDRWRRKTS